MNLKICTPAVVYLGLAITTILIMIYHGIKTLTVFTKIFFTTIWVWFLNFMCVSGYSGISWFLVLIPYILFTIIIIIALEIHYQKEIKALYKSSDSLAGLDISKFTPNI